MSEVWITACGLQTSFGDGAATLDALARGASVVGPLTIEGTSGLPPLRGSAAVASADPTSHLPRGGRKLLKYANGAGRLALCAAGEALRNLPEGCDRQRCGLYLATGLIAFELGEVRRGIDAVSDDDGIDVQRVNEGLRRCHPLMPFKMLLNMPLGLVSIAYGLGGENAILYPGVAQGGAALDQALACLAGERNERVLVGGVVQHSSLLPLSTLSRLGCLATSADDSGLAPADGAAALLLERPQAARERGARPMAQLRAIRHRAPTSAPGDVARTLLSELATLAEPRAVFLSGAEPEQQREAARLEAAAAELHELDGALGYLGAASLATLVAVAARGLQEGSLPGPVIALAVDPRGDAAAALLDTPQESDR